MGLVPTDAHCHADFRSRSDLFEQTSGVSVCSVACFPEDWRPLRNFDAPSLKKAYGIHPAWSGFSNSDEFNENILNEKLSELKEYLFDADALGEIGLDESVESRVSADFQRKAFREQLELAREFSLPIVIHCVGRWGALVEELEASFSKFVKEKKYKFLVHAAKCSAELVSRLEKIGGYFSFGLRELNSPKGIACAMNVSADRIMVESDAEPSLDNSHEVLSKLAELKNVEIDALSEMVYRNFTEFFSK